MAMRSRPACGKKDSPNSSKAPSMPCSSGSSRGASWTWRRCRPRRARHARCTRSTRMVENSSKCSGGRGASSRNGLNSSTAHTQKERTELAAKWIETLTGSLEQKKQYRQYKARIEALPEPYGTAAKAIQRYFMYYGGFTAGDVIVQMMGDFADPFAQAYSGKQWIDKERERLTKTIDSLAGDDSGKGVDS